MFEVGIWVGIEVEFEWEVFGVKILVFGIGCVVFKVVECWNIF